MLKNKEKLKTSLINTVKKMCSEKDLTVTAIFRLDDDGEHTWGIVFGWTDGFEQSNLPMAFGEYRLCGKCAYVSNKSIMHEYNIDWLMPKCNNSDDIDDTDIAFEEEDKIEDSINWLIEQFERYQKEYIHND